jgi:hypothetical protein
MNIESTVESDAKVENAAGQFYLTFHYMSSIGKATESLAIQVPIAHEQPSPNDKKALLEAVTVQGGMGKWTQKEDRSVWLVPA